MAVRYPEDGANIYRSLQIRAKAKVKASNAYVKTVKPCIVRVQLPQTNNRPMLADAQVREIEEQSPVDTLVQTPIEASDKDRQQSLEFVLQQTVDVATGNVIAADQLPFSVGLCSGVIKVAKDVLRYDGSSPKLYRLTIKLVDTDPEDEKFEQNDCASQQSGYCQKSHVGTVDVKILNKNDPPTMTEASNKFTVNEDAAIGAALSPTKLQFSDPDDDDVGKHTFRILQLDDRDDIGLDGSTGALTVKRKLNFERKPSYRMQVSVTDSGGWKNEPLVAKSWITVDVIDVNDKPTMAATLSASINENEPAGTVVINDLGASDEDAEGRVEAGFIEPSVRDCWREHVL